MEPILESENHFEEKVISIEELLKVIESKPEVKTYFFKIDEQSYQFLIRNEE